MQRLREAAEREPQAMDHDAAEVAAMVEFFSQPASTGPPAPNTMKAGLLRGFYGHTHLLPDGSRTVLNPTRRTTTTWRPSSPACSR